MNENSEAGKINKGEKTNTAGLTSEMVNIFNPDINDECEKNVYSFKEKLEKNSSDTSSTNDYHQAKTSEENNENINRNAKENVEKKLPHEESSNSSQDDPGNDNIKEEAESDIAFSESTALGGNGTTAADTSITEEITSFPANPMPLNCLICGKGKSPEDRRPMVRFIPEVGSLQDDISLHVFCGKTAVILARKPQYEILTVKGLKYKHGIGSQINTCISKTRNAISVIPFGDPDEQFTTEEFFLVEEFEENLNKLQSLQKSKCANCRTSQNKVNQKICKNSYQKCHKSNISKVNSAAPHRKVLRTKKKMPRPSESRDAAAPLLSDTAQWTYVHKPTRVVSEQVAAKAARRIGFN